MVKIKIFQTLISESENYQMLCDNLSLQEKYSILISYQLKNISRIFPGEDFLVVFSFPGLLQVWKFI